MDRTRTAGTPAGYHAVTPFLAVKDIGQTIDFYRKAFGAVERMRMELPDTKRVIHGEVTIGDSIVMLGDESPESQCLAPASLKGHHRRPVRLRAGRRRRVQARHRGRMQGHDGRRGHVLGRSRRGGSGPVRSPLESRYPQGRPLQGGNAQTWVGLVRLPGSGSKPGSEKAHASA